jgi:hypothetical protein
MIKSLDINDVLRAEGPEGVRARLDKAHSEPTGPVTLDDFNAYMPRHNYIYTPSREFWPGASVNARIDPVPLEDENGDPVLNENGQQVTQIASAWLDQNKPVEQMVWSPGKPMIIRDRLVNQGGWIERDGVSCFNLYRPPTLVLGNAAKAGPWLDHIHKIYPNDMDHIVKWNGHRAQRPWEKINHGILLGGSQGIGKDTIEEPVKHAVGPWNFIEITPSVLCKDDFNGFVKAVILRINEARDLGDVNRYAFYEHLKPYSASPPDVLRCNEKHLREHAVFNVCGVIITSNYKSNGVFLPADDRRHYVAWSDAVKENFDERYWNRLWHWFYEEGGNGHVAAYLAELDISDFNPKAPPPKTQAFWDIVDANRAPEDAELADALDKLGRPYALTIAQVLSAVEGSEFYYWLKDRKNRRQLPHRFEQCGYVPVRNDNAADGLWQIKGVRQVVYARASLSLSERLGAVQRFPGTGTD